MNESTAIIPAPELDLMLKVDDDNASPDDVLMLLDRIDGCMQLARAIKSRGEKSVIEWMKRTGKDVTLDRGDGTVIRYYLGHPKKTKCNDKAGALDEIFQFTGGDMSAASEFFSSDPFKYGSFRKELGEEAFAKFFTVETVETLEEGKPVKSLQKLDSRFVR